MAAVYLNSESGILFYYTFQLVGANVTGRTLRP